MLLLEGCCDQRGTSPVEVGVLLFRRRVVSENKRNKRNERKDVGFIIFDFSILARGEKRGEKDKERLMNGRIKGYCESSKQASD